MTERYSFAVDSNVVWSQDNVDIVNSTLTDTINEGYVTAEEDSPTRYLSVLDTTLENLNITLTNPKLEAEDAGNYVDEEVLEQGEDAGDQVVVFSVEGSDELFGIQVVRDEEGNLQKYQFQFRKNESGQLEAIPETITLIPVEEEGTVGEGEEVEYAHEEEQAPSMHIFVREEEGQEEHILPDNIEEQAQNQEEEEEEQVEEEETVVYENEEEIEDVKPGIITFQNVKQEMQEPQVEYETPESMEETETNFESEADQVQEHEVGLVEYHTHIQDENSLKETEETQDVIDNQEYEHVEVNPDVNIPQTEENEQQQEEETENTNDSDENDYQIVEGIHITGDVESNNLEHPSEKQTISSNILKHALKMNKDHKIVKKDNRLYLYVVQHPEKENVDSLAMEMSNLCRPKVNPRSILKSSHAMFQSKNEIEDDFQQDERLNKRFARCKEAMQARIFHNFINKTTIPQAPVRKNRLPRKQKIKPVERMDEEIVVQEMMVSSNGFVEAVGGRGVNKENLAVTDYVELTDSDDDYDPKKATRKKKKHRRKRIEITISDDSDASHDDIVIELDESDDEPNEKEEEDDDDDDKNANTPTTKRRRGRPPKNRKANDEESPAKKTRIDEEESPSKPEIPCPKCDKTFPSQNSLKTHLQHHNLQSSIKRALPDYKYKCDKCGTTFINNILLKKHMCSKLFNCPVCKRKFGDLASLGAHKRTHAKEQMVKSTTAVHVSPKKMGGQFKVPKAASVCKCKTCGKLCSSMQNLNVHMRSHREFVCGTCSTTFVSQLMLEKHVRESCVKSPNRRSAGRKSPPVATRTRIKSAPSPRRKSPPSRLSMSVMKVKCDKCRMQFTSHQAVFKHKVARHGLETPDKSVLETEEETKGCGGVPPASRLKNAYAGLRVQLDFDD